MSSSSPRPFGSYFPSVLTGVTKERVSELYAAMISADDFDAFSRSAVALSRLLDEDLRAMRDMVGGGDSRYSYFRGSLLEELTVLLAERVVAETAPDLGVEVIKLGTGQGIVAGVSLAVSRDHVPEQIRISLRRDREDVTVGFRRTLVLYDANPADVTENEADEPGERAGLDGRIVARFPNEIIPVVIIACKMYIDATRLENVIAKASNLSIQHARCTYLVVAEWDALGRGWHDERGKVVDSQYAPITRITFLRGDAARRPTANKRQQGHQDNPYLAEKLTELRVAIANGISAWVAKI